METVPGKTDAYAIKISSFNGDLELSGLNEFRFLISYGISKLCLEEVLRDVQFWPDSWAKKSIWYMDLPIKTIITAKSIILS